MVLLVSSAMAAPAMPEIENAHLTIHGKQRTFLLHTPPSHRSDAPMPLVIALHGYRVSPYELMRQTGFNRLAEEQDFMVVYPQAKDVRWDTRSNADGSDAATEDVEFIQALITHLSRVRNVDTQRIYAAGFSNGGFLTMRLACEISDQIAAYATVSATMGAPLSRDCHPKRPIPILMMHGTDDPIVTRDGQIKRIKLAFRSSEILSFPDAVDFWVKQNQCKDRPRVEQLPDTDPNDGTRVEHQLYQDCLGDAEVQQWVIQGGAHPWPGSPPNNLFYRLLLGGISQDINASEVIWDFFKTHSLNEPPEGYGSSAQYISD